MGHSGKRAGSILVASFLRKEGKEGVGGLRREENIKLSHRKVGQTILTQEEKCREKQGFTFHGGGRDQSRTRRWVETGFRGGDTVSSLSLPLCCAWWWDSLPYVRNQGGFR